MASTWRKFATKDLAIISFFVAFAVISNYIDAFVPHIHVIHIVFLVLVFIVASFYQSLFVLILFTLISSFFGNAQFIIGIEQFMLATLSVAVLLLFSLTKYIWKLKNKFYKYLCFVLFSFVIMFLHLILMAAGDTYYTIGSIPSFIDRFILAIIWPGDWLNVLAQWIAVLLIIPVVLKPIDLQYRKIFKDSSRVCY